MAPGRARAGAAALLLAAAGTLGVGLRSDWTAAAADPASRAGSDFQILWAAGQGWREGLDVHDGEQLSQVGARAGRSTTPFCAAPPLVVGLFGLASSDFQAAYRGWLAANAGLLALAVVCLAGAASSAGAGRLAAAAAALAAVGWDDATWMSLYFNSTNVVALAALAGALAAGCCGRPLLEGVLLAVATLAKLSPALLVVLAAVAGRRRTVGAALLTLLLAALLSLAWLGSDVHGSWLQRVLPALGYAPELPAGHFDNARHAWNLAPHGVLSRELARSDLPRALLLGLTWLATGLVLLSGIGAVRAAARATGGRLEGGELPWLYAVGVTASLLTSSVTWPHHLLLLALPAAWLLGPWGRAAGGTPIARGAGLLACALLFLPLGTLSDQPLLRAEILARAAACVVLLAALVASVPGTAAGPEPEAVRP